VLGNLAQQQEAPSDGTRYDLVLTKPLGGPRTLFLSEAGDSAMPRLAAIESILLVHANVSSLIARSAVGSTDVTGFGLAGALYELSDRGFDVSVCLKSLPVVSEEAFQIPVDCDTLSNERAFGQSIKGYQGTTFEKSRLFSSHYCGPIILLFNEGEGDAACGTLRANGFNDARVIGSVIKRHCGNICVV
jgi:selenophosphate synthase